MTRMSMSVQRLATAGRELLSHHDEITSAASRVEPPGEAHPYHRLVDDAVAEMLQDARRVAIGCRRCAEAIGDHVHDLTGVDQDVADSTTGGRVR